MLSPVLGRKSKLSIPVFPWGHKGMQERDTTWGAASGQAAEHPLQGILRKMKPPREADMVHYMLEILSSE